MSWFPRPTPQPTKKCFLEFWVSLCYISRQITQIEKCSKCSKCMPVSLRRNFQCLNEAQYNCVEHLLHLIWLEGRYQDLRWTETLRHFVTASRNFVSIAPTSRSFIGGYLGSALHIFCFSTWIWYQAMPISLLPPEATKQGVVSATKPVMAVLYFPCTVLADLVNESLLFGLLGLYLPTIGFLLGYTAIRLRGYPCATWSWRMLIRCLICLIFITEGCISVWLVCLQPSLLDTRPGIGWMLGPPLILPILPTVCCFAIFGVGRFYYDKHHSIPKWRFCSWMRLSLNSLAL